MTSDEAISIMNVIVHMLEPQYDTDRVEDAVGMAIKALEQQPTDAVDRVTIKEYLYSLGMGIKVTATDAVDRQAVLEVIRKCHCEEWVKADIGAPIEALQSVTPQLKMGKWKAYTHSAYHGNDEDGEPIWREVTVYHCNMCNRRTVIKENYCPNCGREMQGVEE